MLALRCSRVCVCVLTALPLPVSFSEIPRLRMEAIHVTGVDVMSTQDVFGYFKEYPPAHIEWIDDASCECTTHAILNLKVVGK